MEQDTAAGGSDVGPGNEPPAARAVRWLAETLVSRLTFPWGVVLLAAAVACLNVAWNELSGKEQSILARLTGRGVVTLLDSAVEILPASGADVKMAPSRVLWHHDFRIEFVLELSYLPGRPVRAYRSAQVREFDDAAFWPVLEKQPLFRTGQFTIKIDKGLHALMRTTAAQAGTAFHVADAPENAPDAQRYYWGSQFDQYWVGFDMPMHARAFEWWSDSRDPVVSVRYNPAAPEEFLLETTFRAAEESSSRFLSVVIGVVLGGFGLFLLLIAVALLTRGMNTYVPLALFCGVVIAIPFGSRFLQVAIDRLGLPDIEKSIIEELAGSADARARAGFLEEVSPAKQSALDPLRVDVPHSRYSDVFGSFQVSTKGRRCSSFEEAMQAISAQLAEQLVNMPSDDQFRFFKLLDIHMGQRSEGWDGPFLEGVRTLALDDTRSASLRSWAISAFCDMGAARKDAALAEFIYRQYLEAIDPVRRYWRNSFRDYYLAPAFAGDLRSSDPARIRRALEITIGHTPFLENEQFLAPRLKELTRHSDPAIRELALEKWNSRSDWGEHR
jgi:hypothetical protein